MLETCPENTVERKSRRERPVAVQSFQVDKALKADVDDICRGNGATTSSFLRQCCRRLVSEVRGIEIGSHHWVVLFGRETTYEAEQMQAFERRE